MKNLDNYKKGFTLIELIMIIVILGILVVTALPKYYSLKEEAQRATASGVTASLSSAISALYSRGLLYNTSYNLTDVVNQAQISGVPTSGVVNQMMFTAKIGSRIYNWTFQPPSLPSIAGGIFESGW